MRSIDNIRIFMSISSGRMRSFDAAMIPTTTTTP